MDELDATRGAAFVLMLANHAALFWDLGTETGAPLSPALDACGALARYTFILVAGVALGVTAFVFITALIQGLAVRLTDDVTANSAHVSLAPLTRVARVLPSPDADVEAVAIVSTFQRRQIRAWASTVALLRTQTSVSAISPQISCSNPGRKAS